MKIFISFLIAAVLFSGVIMAETLNYEYSFNLPNVVYSEDGFSEIHYPNCYNYGIEGYPNLPHLGVEILIPAGHEVKNIRIISSSYYPVQQNIKIKPAARQFPLSWEVTDYELIPNEKIYSSLQPFPAEIVEDINVNFLSGHAIASFTICPVSYIPGKDEVKFLKNISIEINTEVTSQGLESLNFLKKTDKTTRRLEQIVENPELLESYSYPESKTITEYDILLISNITLLPNFEDYISYKESVGFTVATTTVEDIYSQYSGQDNQEKIRNCIIDHYQNYSTSFVILAGDSDPNNTPDYIIPHRGFYANAYSTPEYDIPADIYYSNLDGTWNNDGDNKWGEPGEDDLYSELSIGRICVDNATEIQNFTNKLLLYQDDPVINDIEKTLMVGELLWEGTWGGDYKDEVAYGSSAHGYTTVGVSDNFTITRLYEKLANWNKNDIFDQFNNVGINLLNHLGHSFTDYNMKMYISDLTTTNFQNDGITRGFVIGYSQGCLNGSFDNRDDWNYYYNDDCFAEKITTMETAEVANIGNSRYGWGQFGSTDGASQYFDRQFYDAIFGEDITLIGDANADSKEDNVAYISSHQGAIRWCFYELNLFGDPTMDIWTAIPTDITATYPAAIPMGSSQITFQTDAPFARIGVLQNGEIIGRAIADASGLAIVDLFDPIVSPDILSISIIAHNKNRHEGNIVITTDVAYVIFDSYEINDEAGNNNGLLDFGEDILLSLGAHNVGAQIATNVNITLISGDEYITITDNTEFYGNFDVGETIFIEDAFAFEIASDIPDQHVINFEVEISGQEIWTSYFNITVNAPVLEIGSLWIDDSAGGNNDGLLDPGETADIIIESSNFGNCACENTLGTITTGNTYITVTSGTYDLGQLAAGETKQAVYTITVDNTAPIGTSFDLNNIVTSGEYSAEHIFNLSVGLIFEDFETGDFSAFEWEFGGNASWVISTQNPYEGAYCAKSGNISHDQTSDLFITMDVLADDEISFFRKVSSESGWDYLRFYIDGSQLDQWSGEQGWNEFTYPVTEGTHTFKWEYYKDGSVSSGSDCGWIDYIIFPGASGQGNPLSVTASASPSEICDGESSQLNANASGGTGNFEYQWTPTTGLSNPEIQNPVATPTETTTYTVTVDDGNSSISDDVTITVNPTPETPVITEDDDHLISSASEGNQWYDSDGPIAGATDQTYYPTATDDYYVIVTNSFDCVSEPSNVIYFVITGIKEFSGSSDIRIFPNPTTGECTVEFYGNYGMSEIRIINIMNEVVFESLAEIITGKSLNIDLNNISEGVYFLKIKTTEKEIIRKIIVQ